MSDHTDSEGGAAAEPPGGGEGPGPETPAGPTVTSSQPTLWLLETVRG